MGETDLGSLKNKILAKLFRKKPTFLTGLKPDSRAPLIPNYPAFVAENEPIPTDLPPIQNVAREMNAPVAGIENPKKGKSA